jgi:hypothetical protein
MLFSEKLSHYFKEEKNEDSHRKMLTGAMGFPVCRAALPAAAQYGSC